MHELIFEVTQEEDGVFCAKAIGASIFTQGDTWNELCFMAMGATKAHFADTEAPTHLRPQLYHEELYDFTAEVPQWVVVRK